MRDLFVTLQPWYRKDFMVILLDVLRQGTCYACKLSPSATASTSYNPQGILYTPSMYERLSRLEIGWKHVSNTRLSTLVERHKWGNGSLINR